MTSSLNRWFGGGLSALLILGGCGGQTGSFGLNGNAGAAEIPHVGLASAYLTARSALDAGAYDVAAVQLDRALEVDPENAELRNQLFGLYMSSGDFAQARQIARALDETGTAPNDVKLFLALDGFGEGQFEQASEHLDAMPAQGINELVLPFIRAWIEFERGNQEAAIALLIDDLQSTGLSLIRDYHHAAMLALSGKSDASIELLRQIVPNDEPVPSRLMLQRVATEQAASQTAGLQEFLNVQSRVDGGDIVRTNVQRLVDGGSPIEAPIADAALGIADALQSLARALADQGGAQQAMMLGQLSNFVAPNVADTQMFIAELLLRDSRAEDALSTIEGAQDDAVFGYSVRLLESTIKRQQEDYAAAAEILESLAAEEPDRSDALIALGNMHSSNRDYELAEVALSRAVERIGEPENTDWRLFYSRGIAFERTDRWPQAETDFQRALELFPEQPFVLNYLGYSWVDQGINLDEAKGMLRRAVELRPEDGFIVDSLGWAHYRLGDYDEAVEYLERAIELQPGDPVINDHLGDAYWQVGRQREARYQWERAKIFDPEDDVLAAIDAKLADGLDAANAID